MPLTLKVSSSNLSIQEENKEKILAGKPDAEGTGYFSNFSKIIKSDLFNFSGENCVKFVQNVSIDSVEVPTIQLDGKICELAYEYSVFRSFNLEGLKFAPYEPSNE